MGASDYHQLLFDDTDAQARVQLCGTDSASELNLGRLPHGMQSIKYRICTSMKLLLFFIILLFSGCDSHKSNIVANTSGNAKTKTQCIGHNLVDLPDDYNLKFGSSGIFTPAQNLVESAVINFQAKPVKNVKEFSDMVKDHRAEINLASSGKTDQLISSKEIEEGGMLFRVREIDDAYQSEIHWMLSNSYLIAIIHSYKNQYVEAELLLLEFMKNVAHQDTPVVTSSGFCIGELVINGKYRNESATMHFKSEKIPDIAFSVEVDTFRTDDTESLLQRVGGPNALLRKFQANETVLRKGKLSVAGMRAEEWGAAIKLGEEGDQKQLGFTLETMRPVPSTEMPKIHFEMEVTGVSAHDEQGALILWESVTKTMRRR